MSRACPRGYSIGFCCLRCRTPTTQVSHGNSGLYIEGRGTEGSPSDGHRRLRWTCVKVLKQIDLVPIAVEVHRLLPVAPADFNWIVLVRRTLEPEGDARGMSHATLFTVGR